MSTETLARALGEVVRDFDRQIDRHLEAVRMQVSAMIAEGQAKVAEMEARRESMLNDLTAKVMTRLTELKDGQNGADGQRGEKGDVGPQGEQGPAGEPGPQGEAGPVGAQGEAGERGVDGKSVKICGTFDSDAEYDELSIVILGGSSFIALKDAPGPCPGGGWQLLASRGSRGEKGERGERGAPGADGRQGERGAPGDAPAALYIDGSDLVLTMASGAELRTALTVVRK